ncbi:sugar kinase [Jeotgalibacillus sp. S-D1]|nr:sugar kinase [Jeotgalibacillus sp. S-D1]
MVLFTPDTSGPLRYVGGFHKTIGGAESNVAIALTRLGHNAGWISKLGQDEFGLFVRNFIRGEGVDTAQVTFDDQHQTAVFFKELNANADPEIYYYRKHSAASMMTPADLNEDYIKQAKFLHLTGITPALSQSCRETLFRSIEIAREGNQTIVFDPNVRLKLWSKKEAAETLRKISYQSDIVLPGIEEGELMTGETRPEAIAQHLLDKGVQVVVVKLGENGAYYATQNESKLVAGYEVKSIVDTVGAGDGFAAGFLSGLLRGWNYEKSVQLGNRVGAFALTVSGDAEGYPYWDQINPDNEQHVILR